MQREQLRRAARLSRDGWTCYALVAKNVPVIVTFPSDTALAPPFTMDDVELEVVTGGVIACFPLTPERSLEDYVLKLAQRRSPRCTPSIQRELLAGREWLWNVWGNGVSEIANFYSLIARDTAIEVTAWAEEEYFRELRPAPEPTHLARAIVANLRLTRSQPVGC